MPFVDRLEYWARVQPDATAVEVAGDRLSFAELRDRAASLVAAAGENPALTALCLPNGTEFVVRFAAAVAGSGVCAVLDPGWPDAQRAAVEERLREFRPGPPPADTGTADAGTSSTELADGPADSVFLLGFTSGTTSLPKAFTRSRRSWQRSFEHGTAFFGLTRADRTLAPGPLSSSLTLFALAESLHTGAAFFALPSFDVGAAVACVTARRITRIVSAPAALRLISERAVAAGADGTTLTGIVSAGAKLDAATLALVRRWAPNATVFEYYGAAELSFVSASALLPGDEPDPSATAVGRALPGVGIRIRDDEGRELPEGEPGTISVRSPLVSDGYAWGDDGEAFRRDGDWCTVGDQGFLDADAVLHHLGRRADMVVTSGHNVYPHEVEAALQDVPGVRTIIVTGIPDRHRGSKLVAAVIGGDETDAAGLRTAAASLLAAPKRPRAWFSLAEAPVTAAGKISRRMLSDWIAEGDDRVRPLR
ncbi:Acyl-CoA synthetase (AMP-forming)/AMP-acid ligase II [Cryobacterium psychrotolerans]|uniref:Acyl-CoA synthetase (AMP-forming)/AMP-acid ligase II n=1 Tax=Cryobacterium psychrotolerans TaxID=386301 RepID=A0A1G9E7W3_9MICO|nr:AMP-binding protein [Cryobacterium psychrotolerans]TFD86390.1 long-chain fatty acid--CoA ligase [Cryobacterium psychrotolerans]SDK72233.1 Acyl-CoA synthetase (AMP-forming)/AMP-acid ligase II [Cryobacterium psychrotolerans]